MTPRLLPLASLAVLLLLLAAAPPAPAQTLEWSPPPLGATVTLELRANGQTVRVGTEVLAIRDGDLVESRVSFPGFSTEELSLRSVIYLQSAAGTFDIPLAEARPLWPLEEGKSVSFEGTGTSAAGQPVAFATTLTVAAIEEIEVPSGRFLTARVDNETELSADGETFLLNTRQWLDAATGLPVKSEIEVRSSGRLLQQVTMTAVAGPRVP